MSHLFMTEEQYNTYQARVKSARLIRGKASAREERPAVIPTVPVFVKQKTIHRAPYSYEDKLARQLEKIGIQDFEREYRWLEGRKYRADIGFPSHRLIVEIDGAAHRIKGRFQADIKKNQDALLNGWKLLRIATYQVRSGTAADIVRRALECST